MSKYSIYRQVRPKPRQIHPIWRGIGCIIAIIIPAISIIIAWLIVDANWTRLPNWLVAPIVLPELMYRYLPQVANVIGPILYRPKLPAYALFTILALLILTGILSVVYALIYRFIGPPRYSPVDALPPKGKVKRYKR